MDEIKALGIVSALANGIDPLSGETFAADSPYQSPDVVRALFIAVRALEVRGRGRLRQRSDLPNVGKPWSEEEDRKLLAAFDAGRPPKELAKAHGRTLAGIQARLEKHGRIDPPFRTLGASSGAASGAGRTSREWPARPPSPS